MVDVPTIRRPDPLNLVSYATVRDSIQTGDMGLVCGEGPIADIIKRVTRSPYSHVFGCGWESAGGVLMVGESTEPESRIVCLSSWVKSHSGQIDLYRLLPEVLAPVNLEAWWSWILRASGVNYPEATLFHDWKVIAFGEDRVEHHPNSDAPETRRVCSEFLHAALRVNGMTPIVEHDCDAYPSTFAQRSVSTYFGTLLWP